MEKLRPMLKQIFWICTGFVVLLAVSGWWMATGSLLEQMKKDKAKLQTAQKDAKAGADAPNSVYVDGAKQVNKQHLDDFDFAERDLHSRQIKYRTYPEAIAKELPHSFGAPIPEAALRNEYKNVYNDHFVEQLRVLDPFIVQDNKGLISISVDTITPRAEVENWRYNPPTASEIWNAQEDLWLLRSLFESISKVNKDAGADRLGLSPVRQMLSLNLRGGTKLPAGAMGGRGGGMAGGGFGGGSSPYEYEEDDPGVGPRGGGRTAGRSDVGGQFAGSFGTDLLVEEFGADSSGYGVGGRRRRDYDVYDEEDPGVGPGGFGGTGAAPAAAKGNGRYVDDKSEYRTRAFLLHVRVDHKYIPALLTELTNSSFPVEIVRVDAQFTSSGARSSGGMRSRGGGMGERDDYDDDEEFGGGLGARLGGALAGRGGGARRGGIAGGLGGNRRRGRGNGNPGSLSGRGRPGGRGGRVDFLALLANADYNPRLEQQGYAQLSSALDDPVLAELRIGGLLTVYRTKEENDLVEETSEMESKEAEAAESEGSAQPADGGAPMDSLEDVNSTQDEDDSEPKTSDSELLDEGTPADGEAGDKTSKESGEEADGTGE